MLNQIVFAFDTTGSMATCIAQVRRYVEETTRELFSAIPELEIGIISFGDYCDGPNWLTKLELTRDMHRVCNFIRNAPRTSGGDAPEAYEAVIHTAREFNWQSEAQKAFVLIADDIPHEVGYRYGGMVNKYDWRTEASSLCNKDNVQIYTIQCLGNSYATSFYEKVAELGNGYKLDLDQFSTITDLLKAICYKQANQLPQFEAQLSKRGKVIDISLLQNLDVLAGRKVRARKKSIHGMYAVSPSRFQIIPVDNDVSIKDFVEDNGLYFRKGRGFYEFTKPVLVQEYKEVIIQDKSTGEMFSGDKAREILGIPIGVRSKVKPTALAGYRGFIQSTSSNRRLLAGTNFLYEVEK
jgi:hypothetical protein